MTNIRTTHHNSEYHLVPENHYHPYTLKKSIQVSYPRGESLGAEPSCITLHNYPQFIKLKCISGNIFYCHNDIFTQLATFLV